jgi:hypothetical protein
MDAALTPYIIVLLAVLATVVVALVLFALAHRIKKEQTFVGFTKRPRDEKFVGYGLLAAGIVIIAISAFEIYQILAPASIGISPKMPLHLSDITIGGAQAIPGYLLSETVAVSFWLLILGYGGRKLASLGLDMLKVRKETLKRKSKA